MSVSDLVRGLLRRWYLTALVVLVVGAFGGYLFATSGVYTTRTVVSFLLPEAAPLQQDGSREEGIIAFAASVAADVDPHTTSVRYASADAMAYGAGVREGTFVSLPDGGGQWSVSYIRADIDIQIVGATHEEVARAQTQMIADVIATADTQQDAIGVPDSSRVVYQVQPLSLAIEHVQPGRSLHALTILALTLVAIIVSMWAVSICDGRARRRRPRRGAVRITTREST